MEWCEAWRVPLYVMQEDPQVRVFIRDRDGNADMAGLMALIAEKDPRRPGGLGLVFTLSQVLSITKRHLTVICHFLVQIV